MKTHTIQWTNINSRTVTNTEKSSTGLGHALWTGSKLLVASVAALAIIVGTAWANTNPGLEMYLQAITWASGFIFLALAIETDHPGFPWLLATGVALPSLALLSSRVAGEFLLVAAVLLAAWVAAAIVQFSGGSNTMSRENINRSSSSAK